MEDIFCFYYLYFDYVKKKSINKKSINFGK